MKAHNSERPVLHNGARQFVRQAAGVAVIMMSSLACYLSVLKWRGGDASLVTYLPCDEWIPYRPGWVWIYLLPYVVGPLALGLVSASTFYWFVKRGLAVVAISLVIFMAVPTQVIGRPPAHGLGGGLTAMVYENMVTIDEPPANAAPSLHVSLSCLLALALFQDFPRWWPVTVLAVWLVWLATLFTRQHHMIDVASGAVLAVLVAAFWPRTKLNPKSEFSGFAQG